MTETYYNRLVQLFGIEVADSELQRWNLRLYYQQMDMLKAYYSE